MAGMDSATRGCGCDACDAYWQSPRGLEMADRIDALRMAESGPGEER